MQYKFYQQYVEGETVVQKRAKGSHTTWVTIPNDEVRDTVVNEYRLYSPIDGLGSASSVTDKIDLASGVKTDNTKEIVLNGSENWSSLQSTTDCISFKFTIQDLIKVVNSPVILTHFIQKSNSAETLNSNTEWVITDVSANINVSIRKSKLPTQDVAGFKAYIKQQFDAGTPVTVRYQLVTPTTTQLTAEQLATYSPYKKPILLGGVSGVSDKLTMNSDGSLTEVDSTKQIVLNGSGWLKHTVVSGLYYYTDATLNQIATNNVALNCDKWRPVPFNVDAMINGDICCGGSSQPNRFLIKDTTSNTIEEFTSKLNSNPITVRYQLATPITTTIPKEVNSPVLTNQSNILSVDSAVAPSSFSVKIPTTSQIKRQYAQTLLNSYTGTASANLLKDGRVQLDMTVTIPSTFNQTVFSLPVELRPKVARKLIGFNGNNPVTLLVGTDGTVKIPTAITGVVELNGVYNL